MAATIIIALAALWLLAFGSIIKVNGGGILAAILYKAFPIAVSFGLILVALKVI
jgi:hypothetical protein